MKIAIIDIGSDKLVGKNGGEVSKFLSEKLLKLGLDLSKIIICPNSSEEINDTLNNLNEECVFVIGENDCVKNLTIKQALAQHCKCDLVQDDICIANVNSFFRKENLQPVMDYENEFLIPDGAVPFENKKSYLQSFVMYSPKIMYFLPEDIDLAIYLFNQFIIERLVEDFNLNYDASIIKTYGLDEDDIFYLLKDLDISNQDFFIATCADGLDVETMIRYGKEVDDSTVDDLVAKIYEKLNKFIYASEDVSLSTRVFELLKLTGKTLAIAEDITGGNVSLHLMKNEPKISEFLTEGIVCLSNESKINRLGMSEQTLSTKTANSVEGCYEMATGLLEKSGAKIVACISGEFDATKKKQTAFIAIGDIDGVHVYKNVFTGSHETILENITKTTLFYLIKKIKQNGFFFGHITV